MFHLRSIAAPALLFGVLVAFASCGSDDPLQADNAPQDAGSNADGSPISGEAGTLGDAGPTPLVDAALDTFVPPPIVSGLAARPANPTCHAFTPPPASGQTRLVDRFPGVPLTVPTGLVQRPGDNFRWYVTERAGRIVHFPNDPAAKAADVKVALDLRDVTMTAWDCSLGGLAFPADFATSKHAYVGYCYAGPETGGKLQVRVSRFASNDGGGTFERSSEQIVVALDHPGDAAHPQVGLHTSDALRFGKDGYLYAAFGDGGPQGKVGGQQAQDKNDLRGKLLRIDVSDLGKSLTKDFVAGRQRIAADIPPDNPFAVSGGLPAIYAYGFRNPWQWTFDRKTGAIWLGDVGNGNWEEIDRDVQKGGNYGWSVFEGFTCTNHFGAASCLAPSLISPLLAYAHGDGPQLGNAVTGGIVYRGSAVPSLTGSYVFGDSSDAHIWAVRNVDTLPPGQPSKELLFDGAPVSSFAEDQDGELFATILYATGTYPAGKILAFEEAPTTPGMGTGGPPELLSATGCFDPNDAKSPVPALIPFEPSAELWSDGATKRRWFALPDAKDIALTNEGDFDFPPGSVLVKEFTLGAKRMETRFFVRQEADERWAGYTYVWKEDQSDAVLLGAAGSQVVLPAQTWSFPSRAQCQQCHTKVAGTTLGLEVGQLNHVMTYPSTGIAANQLVTLSQIGVLPPLLAPLPDLARLADTTRSVEERARAYLHANCANCHRPDGPTFTPLDLRWWRPLSATGICDAHATIDDLDEFISSEPRLLAPGAPERSVLYWRLFTTDARVRMPPVGRSVSHAAASTVVSDWIKATTTCPP